MDICKNNTEAYYNCHISYWNILPAYRIHTVLRGSKAAASCTTVGLFTQSTTGDHTSLSWNWICILLPVLPARVVQDPGFFGSGCRISGSQTLMKTFGDPD